MYFSDTDFPDFFTHKYYLEGVGYNKWIIQKQSLKEVSWS